MKNFSIEELKTLLADVKNTDDKKTLYVILGVFVSMLAITAGLIAVLVKKHCECCDYECCDCDDWDDEDDEEYFEDDFEDESGVETK
ncbi:MAG TPA: hypothetical protein DIC60_06990 [Lachnospiraceae bacterium]|nr:hypothetical protein [Lachnospiraceae bacterium]